MTTPTDKLDSLLQTARAAAKKLADELEYALELVREEESLEVDLQQLVLNWNRARTELAMAVFGESTLPAGGLNACETAITDSRRVADLETEIEGARVALRYLEQSPDGLTDSLSGLLAGTRAQVAALESELARINTVSVAKATPAPTRENPPAAAASTTKPEPAPEPMQVIDRGPRRCGVCHENSKVQEFEDGWRCETCLRLEEEIASARRSLAGLNAKPLDCEVPREVAGVATIRTEGRAALHALASRRRPASATSQQQVPAPPRKRAQKGSSTRVKRPPTPTFDDLRQRWNPRS
ncbi:hypothetical protein [Rhodococcus marinonascens]|uniref:hypothetical protein n=1 Tax=Rhodococcus marinonascens TaxID=38311 RepID=UPI000934C21B|nr:hypothetical protein [Rhodococcus marinonascens]